MQNTDVEVGRYGTQLVQLCSAFANAESEITERLIRVKNYWIRAEVQLKLVRSIAHILDEEHQKIQHETLEVLASKLKVAVGGIESATKSKGSDKHEVHVHRWKYMLMQ